MVLDVGDLEVPESRMKKESKISKALERKKMLESEVFPPFELLKEERMEALKRYSDRLDSLERADF